MTAFHHRFILCTLGILVTMLGLSGSGSAQSGCKQQCVRETTKCVQYGKQCTQTQNV